MRRCVAPSGRTVLTMNSDPTAISAAQWSARLASFKSRRVSDADPRVVECRSALAYHRVRNAIVADRRLLAPEHVDTLAALLRAKQAVPA